MIISLKILHQRQSKRRGELAPRLRLPKKLFSARYCSELIALRLVDARFAYSDFIIDKIHRLLCSISSSQKISN